MFCRDAMTTDLFWCRDTDTAYACAQTMRDRDVGFVPVLDPQGRPVGVITDRDLATRVLAERRPSETPLYVVMTRDVLCCRPEDELREAEDTMTAARKSRLVVVDRDGRAVGIISLADIARAENRSRAGAVLQAVTRRDRLHPH